MKLFVRAILGLFLGLNTLPCRVIAAEQKPRQKVSAHMRVKNEILTVGATLNSIDGLFDRIVITHSNEKDDGSVAFMNEWCAKRPYCEIYEYPHTVYPSLTKKYHEGIKPENTMAEFGNFGLSKFDPEEWVVNIDADQVYIRERLEALIAKIREEYPKNEKFEYCMKGLNTFSWKNVLVKVRPQPVMGIYCDHYAIKKKNLLPYEIFGSQFAIKLAPGTMYAPLGDIYWFHFKKVLKDNGKFFDKDTAEEKAITYLNDEEADLYIRHIAHYFPPDNPYSLYRMTLFQLPPDPYGPPPDPYATPVIP